MTDLATRESTLLCTEQQPVLRLALQGDEWLWVTTTDSALNKWPSQERASLKAFQRASTFVAGSLPFTRARVCMDGSAPVSHFVFSPLFSISLLALYDMAELHFVVLRLCSSRVFFFLRWSVLNHPCEEQRLPSKYSLKED
jgi:hypothetical protein